MPGSPATKDCKPPSPIPLKSRATWTKPDSWSASLKISTALSIVESDPRTATVIARNIETVGLPGATLRRGAVTAVLAAGTASPVDLVLADLTTRGWAREGTVAVVERGAASAPLTWPAGWESWPHRVYGDTRLELAELA